MELSGNQNEGDKLNHTNLFNRREFKPVTSCVFEHVRVKPIVSETDFHITLNVTTVSPKEYK